MPPTALRRAWKALSTIPDVALGENVFGADGDPAYWVDAVQVANLTDGGGGGERLALRLTRGVIRTHRARLQADERVDLRRSGSDWIVLTVTSPDDVAFAVELAELAATAHRPVDGHPCRPPPTGADLARRRRFH